MPGIFITGTDRGVGKTAVACGILGALRERGIQAAPLKPVECGWTGAAGSWPKDAALLQAASGMHLRREEVAPYVLRDPLSPALAAQRDGVVLDVKLIERAYDSLAQRARLVVVEGTGGRAEPILREPWFTMADLAFTWGMPILIVTRAGAGSINHTMLTVEYARRKGLSMLGLVVNGYPDDPGVAERASPEARRWRAGRGVRGGLPRGAGAAPPAGRWQGMVPLVSKGIDLWRIQ